MTYSLANGIFLPAAPGSLNDWGFVGACQHAFVQGAVMQSLINEGADLLTHIARREKNSNFNFFSNFVIEMKDNRKKTLR